MVLLLVPTAAILSFAEQAPTSAKSYAYTDAPRPEGGILISAKDYVKDSGTAVRILPEWKGRKDVLEWKEGSAAAWAFSVPEDNTYELMVGNYPIEGSGQDVEFQITLDGKVLTSNDTPLKLNRAWRDEEGPLKTTNGNDLRPKQTEAGIWLNTKIENPNNLATTPLQLDLKAGKHLLRLENIREGAVLDYLALQKLQVPQAYEQYRASQGAEAVNTQTSHDIIVTIQAEQAFLKSESSIFPTTDRTSPLTTPYHPTKLKINTIGGESWDITGQWVSWKVDVPEDGWYKIGMRYHQQRLKGAFVSRNIYLDGIIPFREMENVRFPYQLDWAVKELGEETGKPYLFHLTKGVHELKMEVTLGDLAPSLTKVQNIVYELNSMFRKILMITGGKPDAYRDYELQKSIPDLLPTLEALQKEIKLQSDLLEKLTGQQNAGSRALKVLLSQVASFQDRPDQIPVRLESLKNNSTALADWMLEVRYQPLELDYLYAAGADAERPNADATMLQKGIHEIRAFAGSFFENYDIIGQDANGKSDHTINVWVGLGRDQAYVVKRLIDESFTPETGIHVNLNLVKKSLVVATMAGQGPDINLFTRRGEAMDLAIRGALSPLDTLSGFSDIKKQYMRTAFVPYEYQGHTYAIPDEQDFFMMFYRKDILKDLGLNPPQTWDELLRIAPKLQNNNLQVGLPYENLDAQQLKDRGIGMLNLFPSLLMQNGVSVYNAAHNGTNFDQPTAYQAFKQWTDFYKLYNYPLYKNDFFRFRTGEMPLLVSSYKLYNQLKVAAPEIAGQWQMMEIPGMKQPDGSIKHTSGATGTSGIVLKTAKDQEAAWAFMKWWNRADIQGRFSRELENETGMFERRTPANLEAFRLTNWSTKEQALLSEQWKQVEEIPELPGSYFTSRNIDNAFRRVILEWENERESLYYWNKQINEEIKRKRFEFGVKS